MFKEKLLEAACTVLFAWHVESLMVVTLGPQYNAGEKPTVILYT